MCGRYQFSLGEFGETEQIANVIDKKYGAGAWASGEISPSMRAPILLSHSSDVSPELMTWGFRGSRGLVINARAETARERPMFRESVARMRCVVPATGFFEWDSRRRKYLFTLPSREPIFMAGLYAPFGKENCFTILTTEANESMREIHSRMPLVLTQEQLVPWMTDANAAIEILMVVRPLLTRVSMDSQVSLW